MREFGSGVRGYSSRARDSESSLRELFNVSVYRRKAKYFEEHNGEFGCRRALTCPSTKKRNHKMLIKGTVFSRRNAIDISDEE